MAIIGDNYGEMDTETGERRGMGEYGNGNFCNHDFKKIDCSDEKPDTAEYIEKYYYQCRFCGEIKNDETH